MDMAPSLLNVACDPQVDALNEEELNMKTYKSPTGAEIIATLKTTPCTCGISGINAEQWTFDQLVSVE
jgi:hypothetical protein